MATLRIAALRRLSPRSARSLSTATPTTRGSPLRTGVYATALVLSTGLFAAYYLDARSAIHRYIIPPVIRLVLDPEDGHKFALKVLQSGLASRDLVTDDERLQCEFWGQPLSNPVGLAAGFDKDGEAIDGLFNLGFSWVEIGSVTPQPQPGNPRPRVFRLPDDAALINRYGFPSKGHAALLARLRARVPKFLDEETNAAFRPDALLAVNLGKNKTSAPESIEDFVAGVRTFGPHADVLVVNVSSPNTPGLRGLQTRRLLEELLTGVTDARDKLPSRKPKLVLKIAPDLEEADLESIASVVRRSSIDGVIVSNTTVQRPANIADPNKSEAGGLSGAPLKQYSLRALRTLRTHLPASIPLIGCGGISSGADALEYARAGASLVQIYTSFGYDGVGTCRRIKDQLAAALEKEGTTWEAVTNKAVAELSLKETNARGTVGQLLEEARELEKLVDKLGQSMHSSEGEAETDARAESGEAAALVSVVP
ncbi:hypothetical protein PLICRDRAFT_44315 [Plicaturopsis crispa FD-325 SS-3]|nr:hypothetical protein PLICRDRAFT_44315 [Plicaturopsis crispa FD-325 SS-3]